MVWKSFLVKRQGSEWTVWIEDYRIFGGLKKWSEEKLVSNLRFFISGDVKDCVRQKCSEETPKELDELEKEVARYLGVNT